MLINSVKMAQGQYLLIVCVLACLAQTSTAWWWRRRVCPQQRQCSLPCQSGYLTRFDLNGCRIQLCKCIDSCENYNCPLNSKCVKRQYCSAWGGCTVYPKCTAVQVPVQVEPIITDKPTTATIAPRVVETSRCSDGLPELEGLFCGRGGQRCPSTHKCLIDAADRFAVCCPIATTTTPRVVQSSRCSDGHPELEGLFCGRGGQRCPSTHKCLIDAADRFAVCCPIATTTTTPRVVQSSHCSDGQPELEGLFCGRGGQRCPSTHKCLIDAADRFAVCCPIATTTTPRVVQSSRCSDGHPELEGLFCGKGGQRCPSTHKCLIDAADKFAVCCPIATTTTTPRVVQSSHCSDGQPELEGLFCGRGGQRCPSTHKCLIDAADRFAVCCPIPVPNDEPLTDDAELPMCEQPAKTGYCRAHMPRWHFNSATGKCEAFVYGGCNANANNFLTQKACERACGSPGVSYCTLASETGRCRAAFYRFYYNTETNQCQDFIFGGCEGNGNNFNTLSQCQRYCP